VHQLAKFDARLHLRRGLIMPEPSEGPKGDTPQRSPDRMSLWTPLLLALVGLLGTGVGAVLQGFWNTKLEREKFEFSLIQKALDTADKKEASRNLKFLVQAGLISEFDGNKIESLADAPDKLPSFLGTATSIPVHAAKRALTDLKFYTGPIDDENDDGFRKALIAFQASRALIADGSLGGQTSQALRQAAPNAMDK
jgi:Putative peptidoglycan binding domain